MLGVFTDWVGLKEYSYVKSLGMFYCPDDNTAPLAGGFVNSYAFNSMALIGDISKNTTFGTRAYGNISKFASPAVTVLMFEKYQNQGEVDPWLRAAGMATLVREKPVIFRIGMDVRQVTPMQQVSLVKAINMQPASWVAATDQVGRRSALLAVY